jgi:hypothetical protein
MNPQSTNKLQEPDHSICLAQTLPGIDKHEVKIKTDGAIYYLTWGEKNPNLHE